MSLASSGIAIAASAHRDASVAVGVPYAKTSFDLKDYRGLYKGSDVTTSVLSW